ncbi:hypothetical protein SAMN04490370_11523 [Eubacterium ruminantium]|nr:hypothetical protein SAMN04490370_11523 [Eubacterium ruminantium]
MSKVMNLYSYCYYQVRFFSYRFCDGKYNKELS